MLSIEPKTLNWFQATAALIEAEARRNNLPETGSVVAFPANWVIKSEKDGLVSGCVLARLDSPERVNLARLPTEVDLEKAKKMALQINSRQLESPFP